MATRGSPFRPQFTFYFLFSLRGPICPGSCSSSSLKKEGEKEAVSRGTTWIAWTTVNLQGAGDRSHHLISLISMPARDNSPPVPLREIDSRGACKIISAPQWPCGSETFPSANHVRSPPGEMFAALTYFYLRDHLSSFLRQIQ